MEKNNHEQVIKDAQYRKNLSIAFFNATNSAIELVGKRKFKNGKEELEAIIKLRDFFLKEHQNYYATVIANIGSNFDVKETLQRFKKVKSMQDLKSVWLSLSEDERRNKEVVDAKNKLKAKYEKARQN